MNENLVMFACPPLCDYAEAPKDQSKSELFDCPKCNQKMWLSEKKKSLLLLCSGLNKDIFLGCYHCLTKYAHENQEDFSAAKTVKI